MSTGTKLPIGVVVRHQDEFLEFVVRQGYRNAGMHQSFVGQYKRIITIEDTCSWAFRDIIVVSVSSELVRCPEVGSILLTSISRL